MTFLPGLVSVTFRSLAPLEIVKLVRKAGLASIEWGGDIHLPHGDIARAREIRQMMEEHGLISAAYGSYYYAGEDEPFLPVLETALELDAPTIRVWSGRTGSEKVTDRSKVTEDLLQAAKMAHTAGITLSTEFHANTLTDTLASTKALLRSANHPSLKTYWQPLSGRSESLCHQELAALSPWLSNIHLYHWAEEYRRLPLAEGLPCWQSRINALPPSNSECHLLLEFVRDDSPEALQQDAATLRELIACVPCKGR